MGDLESRTEESFAVPSALAGLLAGTVLAHSEENFAKWAGYALIAASIIGGGICYYVNYKRK
ncbi:MAG TPA: hypothetical protein VI612_03385 [Candidatus Nanoarchaeia archaeon]|nr:hypothetical protein [Candidatus Nanoarchaeia archaeon]